MAQWGWLAACAALAACVPAPPFHGDGGGSGDASSGRGPFSVLVIDRDGHGLPDPDATVVVVDPDGSRPPVTQTATGAWSGELTAGATVYVAQAETLTAIVGAEPGDELHVGLPAVYTVSTGTFPVTCPAYGTAVSCVLALPCSQGSSATAKTTPLPLYADCGDPVEAMIGEATTGDALIGTAYGSFPVGTIAPFTSADITDPAAVSFAFSAPDRETAVAGRYSTLGVTDAPLVGVGFLASGSGTVVVPANVPRVPDAGLLHLAIKASTTSWLEQAYDARASAVALQGAGARSVADAELAPWIQTTVFDGSAVTWAAVGSGQATLVVAQLTERSGAPPRAWRWIAAHPAVPSVPMAIPDELTAFASLPQDAIVAVHLYRFPDGESYARVRADADAADAAAGPTHANGFWKLGIAHAIESGL